MIEHPVVLLGVILALTALAFRLERRFTWGRKIGASVFIIVFGALLSNLDLVPAQSPVYAAISGPVTSFAIVWLLLSVRLDDVVRAGPRMLGAFALAVGGTVVGVLVAALLLGRYFPGDVWRLAGALTGTYSGGGLNFVSVGREVGLTDSLFVAAAAADNLVTAVWVGATLMLPVWLARYYPRSIETAGERTSAERAEPGAGVGSGEVLSLEMSEVLALGALAAGLTVAADRMALWLPAVPAVLWLTTLALVAAQIPAVRRLRGSFQLGLVALHLFFAVIGIGSRVSEILAVGVEVLYFVGAVVLVHGLVVYGIGRLLRMGVETLSVASQAAVGGPSTALALAVARRWQRLELPGVMVGLLGYALGNYAGIAMAALLHRLGG